MKHILKSLTVLYEETDLNAPSGRAGMKNAVLLKAARVL